MCKSFLRVKLEVCKGFLCLKDFLCKGFSAKEPAVYKSCLCASFVVQSSTGKYFAQAL